VNRRKLAVLLLAAMLVLPLCACSRATTPFDARAGRVRLPSVTVSGERPLADDFGSGAPEEEILFFRSLVQRMEGKDAPYVAQGEIITLTIHDGDLPTQDAVLEDYLLNADGGVKFRSPQPVTCEYALKGNQVTFTFEKNIMVMLSSDSHDYLPKSALRGFTLRYGEGQNAVERAFLVRTDP